MWYWEIGRFLIGVDFASLDACNEAGVKLCNVLMFLLTCTLNLPLQAIVAGTLLYVAVYMNWNSVAVLSQFLNGMSNLVCALVTLNMRETLISIWYIFIFYIFCNFYLHFFTTLSVTQCFNCTQAACDPCALFYLQVCAAVQFLWMH